MHGVRMVPAAGRGGRGQFNFLVPGKNRLKQDDVRAKEPAPATGAGGAGGGEMGAYSISHKKKKKIQKNTNSFL